MYTTQTCPQCHKPVRVASEHTGRMVRCGACGHVFRFTGSEAASPAAPTAPSPGSREDRGAAVGQPDSSPARRDEQSAAATAPRPVDEPPFVEVLSPDIPTAGLADRAAHSPSRSAPAVAPAALPPAWGLVRFALSLIHWGILGNVLGMIVAVVVVGVFALLSSALPSGGRAPLAVGAVGVLVLLGLVLLAALFLIQIGLWCCCWAPIESRAKLLAIATAVVAIHTLPLMFLTRIVETGFRSDHHSTGPSFTVLPATYIVGCLLGIATTILFTLFLRRVALFFANSTLATSIRRYLIFYVSVLGSVLLAAGLLVMLWLVGTPSRGTTYRTVSPSRFDQKRFEDWERQRQEEERRWREEEQRRSERRQTFDLLAAVFGLGFAVLLLIAAGVNVLWMLELVRRTRNTIARAENAAAALATG